MPKFRAMKAMDCPDVNTRTRTIAALSAAVLTGLVGLPSGWADESTETRLRDNLKEILKSPELDDAVAGIHVRDLSDGRTLFDHNADKLFNPASNQKLLTTAAALFYLGSSYRFATEVWRRGPVRGGVLKGDLYVVGRGDPTLTTEALFGL
ncbi:MAG: D-alanyl-D-alanine carboxypeptidase, partial [Myxococcota bacterium]